MVLNPAFSLRLMALLAVAALGTATATAQKLKTNEYDRFLKQQRLESFPVTLKNSGDTKMDLMLRAADTSFFLQLKGYGVGTSTVDEGSPLVFRLENGDSVVVRSNAVQSFDLSGSVPTYQHDYALSFADLEKMGRSTVRSLRKFSAGGFDDVVVDKKSVEKLRGLAQLFAGEAKAANLIPASYASRPPAFPGGADVWLRFFNRNLRVDSTWTADEPKTAVVKFVVAADGEVKDLTLAQPTNTALDEELLRILRRMPRWKPAVQSGKPTEATVTQMLTVGRRGEGLAVTF